MPVPNTEDWMTMPAVARYLGLNIRTVLRMAHRGELPAVVDRRTHSRRIRRRDLDAWIERQRIRPGELWKLDPYSPEYKARAAFKRATGI